MSEPKYEIPNDDAVYPGDIKPDTDLSTADLSKAYLVGADLRSANLSGANLGSANLSEANLYNADLSEAILSGADLSNATIDRANLLNAELIATDLSDASLIDITLGGATFSRRTNFDPPIKQIEKKAADMDEVTEEDFQDIVARMNHELREAYSENGLLGRARKARVRERRARRREAKAEEGWGGTVAWGGSLLSSIFTGYGVRLTPVIGWMLALYFLSAGVYWHVGGMAWDRSLYYSIVTFTTAPPEAPPSYITSIVAGIETFAGTAAIIFLGYVLGSRERI